MRGIDSRAAITVAIMTYNGALTVSTWKDFKAFVERHVGNDVASYLDIPNEDTPNLIAAWIFMKCDNADYQKHVRLGCQGFSFSTALRMRASVSFHYNQLGRSGNWNQMMDGSWAGNPSLSNAVSRYMLSLQRRKVCVSGNLENTCRWER